MNKRAVKEMLDKHLTKSQQQGAFGLLAIIVVCSLLGIGAAMGSSDSKQVQSVAATAPVTVTQTTTATKTVTPSPTTAEPTPTVEASKAEIDPAIAKTVSEANLKVSLAGAWKKQSNTSKLQICTAFILDEKETVNKLFDGLTSDTALADKLYGGTTPYDMKLIIKKFFSSAC